MNRIKEARIAAGLSQKFVAVSLGIAPPSVSNWESGKTQPTPENLKALAELYGVSTDYLLGRDDPDPAPMSPAPPEPLVKMVVLDPNPPDLSSVDFTDQAIQAKLLKPGHNYSPEAAAIVAELMAKIMRLTPEQLTQAEAFVSFLENQQKE